MSARPLGSPDLDDLDDVRDGEAASHSVARVPGQRTPGEQPPTKRPLTAQAVMRLATPEGIRVCLQSLGLVWSPRAYSDEELLAAHGPGEPGLYAWVFGPAANDLANPVLYLGVGAGQRGMQGRLKNETTWIGPDYWHGHGMTMHRLGGRAVGGPVTLDPEAKPGWLADCTHPRLKAAQRWLATTVPANPLTAAERLAIRISLHLGDVVAPANSVHAGAWLSRQPWETLAYLAVARFTGWPRQGVPRTRQHA